MDKRGQVTIFIILAIVIIAGIAIYLSADKLSISGSSAESNEIDSIIEECAMDTAKDVLYIIGQYGGYYESERSTASENIPYYYKGQTMMPSTEKIENEINSAMNELMSYCINGLENLSVEVTDYEVKNFATIEENEVLLLTTYSATIIKNDKTKIIENEIESKISARVGLILESSKEILRNVEEEICLTCIADIAETNDLKIDIVKPYNTTYFTIQDENSKLNNIILEWKFAYEN